MRDSNPRYLAAHLFSRQAPSTTRTTHQVGGTKIWNKVGFSNLRQKYLVPTGGEGAAGQSAKLINRAMLKIISIFLGEALSFSQSFLLNLQNAEGLVRDDDINVKQNTL